ncbi:MAG: hypothetical protein WAV50_02785, partial [Minisyncoccia bacterium]
MKRLLSGVLMAVLAFGMFIPALAQETGEQIVLPESPAIQEPAPEEETASTTPEAAAATSTPEEAPVAEISSVDTVLVEEPAAETVELIVKFKES